MGSQYSKRLYTICFPVVEMCIFKVPAPVQWFTPQHNFCFTLLPFKWPVNSEDKIRLCAVVNCCTAEPWNIKRSKHLPRERLGDLWVNLLLRAKMQASAFEYLKHLTSQHTNCIKWISGSFCSANFPANIFMLNESWARTNIKNPCKYGWKWRCQWM